MLVESGLVGWLLVKRGLVESGLLVVSLMVYD